MNWKFASAVFALTCLIISGWFAFVTGANAQTKPVIFTTTPKLVNGQLWFSDGANFAVRIRASLTATAAKEDDTLTGALLFVLPDDVRKRIAQNTGKTLNDISSNVILNSVSANFRHGTACPLVQMEISAKEIEVTGTGGAKLKFDHLRLDIQETPGQINQLFCNWTRQINAKRQRQGIIAAINRLIQPEEQTEEPKKTTVENPAATP